MIKLLLPFQQSFTEVARSLLSIQIVRLLFSLALLQVHYFNKNKNTKFLVTHLMLPSFSCISWDLNVDLFNFKSLPPTPKLFFSTVEDKKQLPQPP